MWTSFFLALAKVFGFAEKAIPSDVIRNDNHVIRKPRIEGAERAKILRKCKTFLKHNRHTNIETYVNYTYDSLDLEDRNELIQLLTEWKSNL